MDEGESGRFAVRLDVNGSGWIAARCWGRRRNSYGHALWAHTSPVYLSARPNPGRRIEAATFFVEQLDRARNWLGTEAHYEHSQQRDRMLALFRDARTVYERWRHD